MSSRIYIEVVDLDTGEIKRFERPDTLVLLDDVEIEALGKCAKLWPGQGIVYVATHSRCAARLWKDAANNQVERPSVPWVAFKSMDSEHAANLGWAWISLRERARDQ